MKNVIDKNTEKTVNGIGDDHESHDSGGDDCFVNIPTVKSHEFYLNGEIEEPTKYSKWFNIIRSASSHDNITIHINSYGGSIYTAIQFIRVMAESRATVAASVEGACMSAATMIFLASDIQQISEHSVFMFHNYSSFSYGKGGELYDNIVFERKWSKNLLSKLYMNFLTKAEIKDILNNRDIWMDCDEVIKRLKKRDKIATAKREAMANAKGE